ncbi:ABC transporter ATP-binding protein [Candidatus Megaera polyxenophila]|jgi:polar amino acid transport system ATP-binding protein|uniref:amino acid ABC transporter ATP-binding protein n=1 Tax=Candidatus Megaera polyxenophila TaxID=988779 RepID=UPI00249DB235|nr:amino acid ABC transporter ATP-binding protein [Candidatus Megaera polyxenophila]BBB56718.1 ABC transporter ATP-binding protein [Candidatus Megaera polyxenophila]
MIALQNVSKSFAGQQVISDINLVFDKRETVVIIGPSGSGKSTLIRCINNLENPTTGAVLIDGKKLTRRNRGKLCFKIGMVFQQFHLFPHMTVLENLTYGPINVIKARLKESEEKAKGLLKQFGVLEKAYFYPMDLSGGQKQRVAIARALMMNPEIMLFDEPTSALDPEVVKDIIEIIFQLKNQITMIVITHHVKFAKIIADRVIFMDQGKVLADQPANEFFKKPNSHRARLFLQNVVDLI